jgi:hypothetical protein
MSERTFRAIVAAVLIGALALAAVVVVASLYRPSPPTPSPSPASTATSRPPASPTATPFSGPVFETPGVVSVGRIARGRSSNERLVLEFVETQAGAIRNAPGSFVVRLADGAGDGSTVGFVGVPEVAGPGSLGATAILTAPNVLRVDISGADPLNIEAMTVAGLGISAASTAAIGPVTAEAADFSGSLANGTATGSLASPGTIVEAP